MDQYLGDKNLPSAGGLLQSPLKRFLLSIISPQKMVCHIFGCVVLLCSPILMKSIPGGRDFSSAHLETTVSDSTTSNHSLWCTNWRQTDLYQTHSESRLPCQCPDNIQCLGRARQVPVVSCAAVAPRCCSCWRSRHCWALCVASPFQSVRQP